MQDQTKSLFFQQYSSDKTINNPICGLIYKVTNLCNNKLYIGMTTKHLEKRKHDHEKCIQDNSGFIFHRALEKYGLENFKWEIIDHFYTKEEGVEKEKYHIEFYDTWKDRTKGYNLTAGGQWGDTISQHPDKEKIIEKSRQSLIASGKSKGKNNPMFGRNDQIYKKGGAVDWNKNRIGKSNAEFFGEEKAKDIAKKHSETILKNKDKYNKPTGNPKQKPSIALLSFIMNYGFWDKNISNITYLCSLFIQKNWTPSYINKHLKKQFPIEYEELKHIFKSRFCSGEKNGRFGKEVKKETRDKIGNANRGKGSSKFKKIKLKEDYIKLIDIYFDTKSTKEVEKRLNISDTLARIELIKLGITLFSGKRTNKKVIQWFKDHTKEEFYEKIDGIIND